MELPPVASLRWANVEQTAVDCIVTLGGDNLPFTASAADPEELGQAIFTAAAAGDLGDVAAYEAPPAPEPTVPSAVTRRQLKLALLAADLLDDIEGFVASGAVPRAAVISWNEATEYHRNDPMLNEMAAHLTPPMSAEQIDQLFVAAAAIQ